VLADWVIDHASMANDEVRILIDFNAQVTKDLSTRSDVVDEDAFVLQLPDGTSIAANRAASEYLDQKGVSAALWVEFVIPFPAAGEYVLEAREMAVAASTPRATAELPFSLPSFPSFGEK
jgi:hypothetical protein